MVNTFFFKKNSKDFLKIFGSIIGMKNSDFSLKEVFNH